MIARARRYSVVAAMLLLAGCGSTYHIPSTPAPVAASDATNGGTVTLTVPQRLTVTLHSTYWQFDDPSDPSIVIARGGPISRVCANPPPFPGSGCGTVVQVFEAERAGKAVLTASRNSCGEAMPCRPDQAHWQLTVLVR